MRGRKFDTTAPLLHETTRVTPRALTVQSDVITPLLIAAVTGLVFAVIGLRLRSDPVLFGVGAFALAWFAVLVSNRFSLYAIETAVGYDLDGDRRVGPPTVAQELDLFLGRNGDGDRTQYKRINVPVSAARLGLLVSGFLEGHTSEGEWAIGDSKRFTIDEFRACRAELLRLGLIEWVNAAHHGAGVRVSDAVGLAELRDGLMNSA